MWESGLNTVGLIISANRNPSAAGLRFPNYTASGPPSLKSPITVHTVTLERTRIMIDRTLKHYRVTAALACAFAIC
jgi:hypothetical protein